MYQVVLSNSLQLFCSHRYHRHHLKGASLDLNLLVQDQGPALLVLVLSPASLVVIPHSHLLTTPAHFHSPITGASVKEICQYNRADQANNSLVGVLISKHRHLVHDMAMVVLSVQLARLSLELCHSNPAAPLLSNQALTKLPTNARVAVST
jgi:hypothetical protein